nr:MAG TPA: hypothetical protein [Caudoviricetes sp.]
MSATVIVNLLSYNIISYIVLFFKFVHFLQ